MLAPDHPVYQAEVGFIEDEVKRTGEEDGEVVGEDLRMNKRGKIEYDVDYSDLPNELEDDFSMAKLKKEYEKAVKNKTTKEAQDIIRLAGL